MIAAVVSPAVGAHGEARDSLSEASSSGAVHTAPGIDPVCATLKETLLNSPPDGPINWDDYNDNDLVWSDPPRGPRHKHKIPPSNVPLKPVVLPRALSYASESDFDFFNNGRITRVFRNIFGDHYMHGSWGFGGDYHCGAVIKIKVKRLSDDRKTMPICEFSRKPWQPPNFPL